MARSKHLILKAIGVLAETLRRVFSRDAGPDKPRDTMPRTDAPQADASPPIAPRTNKPARSKNNSDQLKSSRKKAKPVANPEVPCCPHCKKPMVIKVARTGKNAGEFWGCAAYPACRGIRPIFR
ncbi:topoisomerase DNA-binding C4 zinc finger domain-containing protein [Pseudomonas sp. CDFA 602]|uniref:topoisomerase DNA-binding C4 zinc finger domain-containing protein n=1 Tax=Pseudomonas californiensis TaxID=2829823 RepID=UPI0029E7D441|nr:topoisomerase DNA-binding C4 zinc finger domain-containing protein [Pseudomonas californiensis]MCD5996641.1 topoisomerase DNA-binding C4 zinc finger domain-containing protein [Pseudomonas californiensis]MCD6002288.1 topoisomerase DNA-binding C4 zinc finger domain-containing protein [Pseudomonas californiensis]